MCEQVSHHPPISAMYGESKYTKIWANTAIKVNASLKGLSLNLSSLVYLHHFNPELGFYDKYEINFPESSITNVLFGKTLQFEHWGSVKVKDQESDMVMEINLEKSYTVF